MATRAQLYQYFETNDYPTEAQFKALIDSLFHAAEDSLDMANITGLVNALAAKGNSVFYEFTSGELTDGVIKEVTHGQNLSGYIIQARSEDGNNNATTNILRPNDTDPNNKIDIQVYGDIPAPGLRIQIVGVKAV